MDSLNFSQSGPEKKDPNLLCFNDFFSLPPVAKLPGYSTVIAMLGTSICQDIFFLRNGFAKIYSAWLPVNTLYAFRHRNIMQRLRVGI